MVIVAHERAIIKLKHLRSIERNAVPEIRDTLVNAAIRGDTSNNNGTRTQQQTTPAEKLSRRYSYIIYIYKLNNMKFSFPRFVLIATITVVGTGTVSVTAEPCASNDGNYGQYDMTACNACAEHGNKLGGQCCDALYRHSFGRTR